MNSLNNNIEDSLLAKYLDGSATHQESAYVEAWIEMSSVNREYFEHFQTIWFHSEEVEINTDINFDKSAAFKKVLNRIESEINTKEKTIPPKRKITISLAFFSRVAAVLVIGVFTYFIFQKITSSDDNKRLTDVTNETEFFSADSTFTVLPDNSIINLNTGTEVKYAKNFSENRTLQLTGEAFFEVNKLAGKPFRVLTNDLEIKVLGTSFYVTSMENDSLIEVGVISGTVQVLQKVTQDTVILNANESLTYNKNTQLFSPSISVNNNALFWKTGVLEFSEQSLDKVLSELTNAYGAQINFEKNEIENCTFTGRFQNATLEEILEQLEFSFKIVVTHRENGEIDIKGQDCKE
ncbi:FecR family protein [Fulvivirgaceae bacterium LMO-SS25]